MKPAQQLTAGERDFFQHLAQFVFSNPFSEPRARLLTELVPGITLPALLADHLAFEVEECFVWPQSRTNKKARGPFGCGQTPISRRETDKFDIASQELHLYDQIMPVGKKRDIKILLSQRAPAAFQRNAMNCDF